MNEAMKEQFEKFLRLAAPYIYKSDIEMLKKLAYQVERKQELWESAIAVTRRYQREREALIHRISLMANGAYTAYLDMFCALLPLNIYLVKTEDDLVAFPSEKEAQASKWFDETLCELHPEVIRVRMHWGNFIAALKKGVK